MSETVKLKFSTKRIRIIFTLSLVCAALSFLWAIMTFLIGIYSLSYFLIAVSILFITSAFLSKNRFPGVARILFILLFNISITYVSSYIGKGASVEFFLMFAVGIPFIIFSHKRDKIKIFIFSLIPILLWLLLFITDFKLFVDVELKNATKVRNIIYYFSITIGLLLVVFQLIFYSYGNARINKKAHSTKQKAIDASNAKSQFLSTMSHEIRTPLNAVIGLSHILGDNNPRKDQVQNIEALNYSGKILLNLLNNVLDFSKMESTNIELDNIPINLYDAIKQIKKVHEASCLKKGLIMNLEIDKNIPIVWLDIVRFNQVINNLVANAIKFTEKGSITLKIKNVKQTKKTISLLTEIIDTGIGIPKDKQETIWEAFTQASSQTNRLYGGTGLGLPIVKSIVKAMGSKVKIDSDINKGSRFYFQISLKKASAKELEKTKKKKTYNFKGKKALLVEDNDFNVLVGKQILEKVNLKVEIARDGLTALNLAKETNFDIILMDIQMPIMDGYTASKEIRKFNKKTPILALSASVFMKAKDKIKECGMNGFIYKPFDPDDLLKQIQEVTSID
ncbi:two-component system sensor histidine kinase/response regulator [Polaribacter reichenbachii]|uniref:histidine kinase n=1 Tax=Polaribacter reichenbachii TaxID=996801 RepID=A0A1B8TPQ6_9FLAO|nr:ATP-binding protein [Polaribacter reichenbachii]APZ46905.1 two-component system sensor histidine kinase/response regulator [Polaribacter reichenbachii]AUC17548.1 two-component system sensor histidine kinase/response regulator [Polaribacter reichenbachii]OBY61579.1 two-component system sensor histidine kinase/response regulator [Polaribacter reichenbachii]